VRTHFPISEVIGRHIAVKRHGREYQALCPFHKEKSPSFTINDEKNFYHCFGCGAHGDAFSFLMQHQRLSYPEAVEALARQAGIPLPEISAGDRRQQEAEKTIYDVCEAACQWFERQLQSAAHTQARDYLERRGLTQETIRQFRVGYAPEGRTALSDALTQQGFPRTIQAEAGLIIVPDDGAAYDRFRGRIMFPIRSASGKVIAFGGRLLATSSKNLPKYLNSPETSLFKKGELLFNLDLAKRSAREANMVAVMEGYMDVIATAQAGIPYAVATLGTAITAEHLRLLWQLAKEPVLCFDGDTAGKRAMLRAVDVALPHLKAGYALRFAMLPKGEDPDSYLKNHGKSQFEAILQRSKRLSQVIWETLLPQYNVALPEGKAALESALAALAARIGDTGVRQHYLSYFKKLLWERATTKAKPQESRSPHIQHMAVQHHSAALNTLVKRLLATIMRFPALLHKSQVEETLSRLDIRLAELDAVRNIMLAAIQETNIDDHATFAAYVKERVVGELVDKLLEPRIKLPYADHLSEEDALLLWHETSEAYQISHLQYELEELQQHLSTSLDERVYQRLVELKQAINKAQAERTFAPAASEAG
jgi:DNA primase